MANGPTALIVEDEIISQRVAEHILKGQGYQTATARDGLEALRLLEEQRFNLVLMDINLPVLDGVETTKRIRNSSLPCASVPIIALSSNPLRMEEDNALVKGFNAYLLKPLESRALQNVLRLLGIDKRSIEQAQMI